MTDGIATGWHHALWAIGYLYGAVLPLMAVALFSALIWWAWGQVFQWVDHRRAVAKVRRQQRRSGRTV